MGRSWLATLVPVLLGGCAHRTPQRPVATEQRAVARDAGSSARARLRERIHARLSSSGDGGARSDASLADAAEPSEEPSEPLPAPGPDASAPPEEEGLVLRWLLRDRVALTFSREGTCEVSDGALLSADSMVALAEEDLRAVWAEGGMACRVRSLRLDGDPTRGPALLRDGNSAVRVVLLQGERLLTARATAECAPARVESFCGRAVTCGDEGAPALLEEPRPGVAGERCLDALRSAYEALRQQGIAYDEALEAALPVVAPSYSTRSIEEDSPRDEAAPPAASPAAPAAPAAPAFDLGLTRPARRTPSAPFEARGCARPSGAVLARVRRAIEQQLVRQRQEQSSSDGDETPAERSASFLRTLRHPALALAPSCAAASGEFLLRATHPEQLGEDPGGYTGWFAVSANGGTVSLLSEPWYGHDVVLEVVAELTGDRAPEVLQVLHLWESAASGAQLLSASARSTVSLYDDPAAEGAASPHAVRIVTDGAHNYVLFDWELRAWNGTAFAPLEHHFLQGAFTRRREFHARLEAARAHLRSAPQSADTAGTTRWLVQLEGALRAASLPAARSAELRRAFTAPPPADAGTPAAR